MLEMLPHSGLWLDLFDIGLVAFIIYRLSLLLKGTMALRLLSCLGSLFLAALISQLMGLQAIEWILDRLLASVLVILVIIFQHDIRRALVTSVRNGLGKSEGR